MQIRLLWVLLGLLTGVLGFRAFAGEETTPKLHGRWERIACPAQGALLGAHFGDDDTGWIVGEGGTILHTKNGGGEWTTQESGTSATLMGVHFLGSGKVGWAVGASGRTGIVLRTDDGGKIWTKLQVRPFPASSVFAVGKDTVYFTDYGGAAIPRVRQGFHADGDVVWTRDGGRSWENNHRGPWVACRPMFDICFAGPSHGWAVGGQALCIKPNTRLYKPKGFVVHTTDGGDTWEVQGGDIPLPPSRLDVTPGSKAAGLGLKTGDILVAWNGNPVKDYLDYKNMRYPTMPSPFGLGRKETVALTVQRNGEPKTVKIELVTGEPPGFAVGDSDIPLFYGVSFADKKTGWIVGEAGLVYRTRNGGKSWIQQATPDRTTLWSVCALDSGTAFAVGEGGTVLCTTGDTGTWVRVPAPAKGALYAVDFPGKSRGFAVGAGGVVLRWSGEP